MGLNPSPMFGITIMNLDRKAYVNISRKAYISRNGMQNSIATIFNRISHVKNAFSQKALYKIANHDPEIQRPC